jgi:hypothetical protein
MKVISLLLGSVEDMFQFVDMDVDWISDAEMKL